MGTFVDEARALADLVGERAQVNLRLTRAQNALARRELALVPEKGWPGSNPEARALARQTALWDDKVAAGLLGEIEEASEAKLDVDARCERQSLVLQGMRWDARQRIIDLHLEGETELFSR